MTDSELRTMCELMKQSVTTVREHLLTTECLRLLDERDGERKAKELALKGLESVTELYDAQKHELRQLRERLAKVEAALTEIIHHSVCCDAREIAATVLAEKPT